jgi:cysteine desulfurase family protein (TIGR01976 family)
MTQLTYDLSRALAKTWRAGDEIVVSRLDHDANIRPWVQAAAANGATVRWAEFDPDTGELPASAVESVLSERTRLVACTGASNLLGTRPPVPEIAAAAHAAGALLFVDGVHLTPHAAVDMDRLGADFYACSPYKFFGPHCGVLAAAPARLGELQPDKLLPSSDSIPERFELGTLPYELMAGTAAAVDFVAGLAPGRPAGEGERRGRLLESMRAVEAYEDGVRAGIEEQLSALPGVTLHSRALRRTPTLLATFAGVAAAEVAERLAGEGVNAPAGSFYAVEASRRLGLGDAGGLRIGIAPYTDSSDADRLVAGIRRAVSR